MSHAIRGADEHHLDRITDQYYRLVPSRWTRATVDVPCPEARHRGWALSPAVGHRNLIAIDIQIGERDDPV
jgi:hypothetical protein